jgi:Protein of unknown function (DUF4238)
MSIPKRHHFVPQFYLRRFSENGRSIICYHKKSGKLILNASIKGQCAIDNFYSWQPEIENALATIESKASVLFKNIVKDQKLPPIESEDYLELLIFTILQMTRTQLAGEESDELFDYYMKLRARGAEELEGIDLDKFRIKSKFPAAMPMSVAMETYHVLYDLSACLLVNNTKCPFFTSDHPVLLYNSQKSHIDWKGVIGLNCTGLQVIFPIDTNHALYFYDKKIYSKPSNTESRKLSLEDAIKINTALYMWSGKVVYISNKKSESALRLIAETSQKYLPFERTVSAESETQLIDGENRSLVHSFQAHVPLDSNFKFSTYDKKIPIDKGWLRGDDESVPIQSSSTGRIYNFDSQTKPVARLTGHELNKMVVTIKKQSIANLE